MTRRSEVRPTKEWASNKDIYRKHIQRVFSAETKLDRTDIKVGSKRLLGLDQLSDDYVQLRQTRNQNNNLLIQIYDLKEIRSGLGKKETKPYFLKKRSRRIGEENLLLAQRLEKIENRPRMQQTQGNNLDVMKNKSDIPEAIVKKYSFLVDLPKNPCMQNKIFRPKVFFDLMVRNDRSYGRIVFQLYTEVCPELILEFVRFCANAKCDQLRFPHLFSQLWLECAMIVNPIEWDPIEYDIKAFKSSEQSGALLFALQDFKALKVGMLAFSISFRPISVLDNKRFAFGKIVSGKNNFMCLQDNGSKNGRPKKDIVVTSMGVVDS